MTRSYIAFTVQKRELTLENPFLYWKGFTVLVLKSDNIANSRTEWRGIVLTVPSNQIKVIM